MSEARADPLLIQAEEKEKEYDWLGAAGSYLEASGLVSDADSSKMGEVYERSGYALYKAAMQAETVGGFRETMQRAIHNYGDATELFEKLGRRALTARALRCRAMIAYLGYWLASEAREKKRLVDEAWTLTKEALKVFAIVGQNGEYGRTYNQLAVTAVFGFLLEWNPQSGERILSEVVEHGERTIKFLSDIGPPDELAKAYSKTAAYLSAFGVFLGLDEQEKYSKRGYDYWRKANEVSEDAVLQELPDYDLVALEGPDWGSGTDEALRVFGKGLEYGRKTKDRLIAGCSLDALAYHATFRPYAVEDPDEIAKMLRTALQHAEDARRQFSAVSFISPRTGRLWVEVPQAEYYLTVADWETDLGRRHDLLEKALEAAPVLLKRAEDSGYPSAMEYAHHVFSKILQFLAGVETDSEKKRELLEKALSQRNEAIRFAEQFEPFNYFGRGVNHMYLAGIRSELATLPELAHGGKGPSQLLLSEAIRDLETSLKLGIKHLEFYEKKGSTSPFPPALGRWQYQLGDLLNHLHQLTGNRDDLRKAADAFEQASEFFRKNGQVSRMAECYWKAARTRDSLEEHLKAAELFLLASKNYSLAAEKIPQLKELSKDHASYMEAWSQIEKGRYHHGRQDYGSAKKFYEVAAKLHKSTKQWSYLAPNYSAWARLEEAEDLGRKGQAKEAIQTYEDAARLFREAKSSLQAELKNIESQSEKQAITKLSKAVDVRVEYCNACIALEEAKILEKEGDNLSSSNKYGKVAETLEKIIGSLELEQDQSEIKRGMTLAKAWQTMMRAEVEASPGLYLEAARLFEDAKGLSRSEHGRLVAMGHSRFCRALEVGARFEDSRDVKLHSEAMEHLESASNHYLKAGFDNASEYAEASKLLLDAYACLDRANKETDQEKKAKLYIMAEKVLQTSADYYGRAEYPAKRDQVLRQLEKVKKERELAVSLTEIFRAPFDSTFSPSFITTPTTAQEKASGLERFEHADVQARVITRRRSLMVGEDLDLEIELVNAGRGPAQLVKVEEVIPEGFELTEKPEPYRVEDSCLNMKGKRLDPLKTEDVKLVLRPKIQGKFRLKPRILYLDEGGKYKSREPGPIDITVKELGISGWIKGR